MAYESSTYNNQEDLMVKLHTFAVAGGTDGTWTNDDLDTTDDEMAISKGTVFVQFAWDNTDHIWVFQSTSHDGSAPGSNPGDSGNGVDGNANTRKIGDIGNGSGTYWFFSNATGASENYIHVVIEYTPGFFRHFGFGDLVKIGDWTGGAYAYGMTWDQLSSNIDLPNSSGHTWLLDTIANTVAECATIRMEGFQGEPSASSKWGVIGGSTSVGNDGDGVGRTPCFGGSRGGPYVRSFGMFRGSALTGAVPGCPNVVVYRNLTPSPDRWFFMGYQPDVRIANIKHFVPKQEYTFGSETWVPFPMVAKSWASNPDVEQSGNGGVFYKKNTS